MTVWQVEMDHRWDRWADYSWHHARTLEAAFQRDADEVELDAWDSWGGYDLWQVSLSSMLQRNSRTGTLRRIRRMLVTHW